MVELYPFEAICLSILWYLIGSVAAFAVTEVLLNINQEDDDEK